MTTEELSVFLSDYRCGCSSPEDWCAFLLLMLNIHPLYDHRGKKYELLGGTRGLEEFVLYTLDHMGLTEHGGSVGGAWLTEKGRAVRDALQRESLDDFASLNMMRCVHGIDTENMGDHKCE